MWTHIGRLWTNGEPFLVMDAGSRGAWRGGDDDVFEEQIVDVGEVTDVPVGAVRAALIGDGVVRDDSWIEVFRSAGGTVAFVQAAGEADYPGLLARALAYPGDGERDGADIAAGSGELAVFSSATDGAGELANPFVYAQPGPVPRRHDWPSPEVDPGLLIGTDGDTSYRLTARSYTELDGEPWGVFGRWLLIPRR